PFRRAPEAAGASPGPTHGSRDAAPSFAPRAAGGLRAGEATKGVLGGDRVAGRERRGFACGESTGILARHSCRPRREGSDPNHRGGGVTRPLRLNPSLGGTTSDPDRGAEAGD